MDGFLSFKRTLVKANCDNPSYEIYQKMVLYIMLSNYGVLYFMIFVALRSFFSVNLYSEKKNGNNSSFLLNTMCLVSPDSF